MTTKQPQEPTPRMNVAMLSEGLAERLAWLRQRRDTAEGAQS